MTTRFDEREYWNVLPDHAPDDLGDGPGGMMMIGIAALGLVGFVGLLAGVFLLGRWTVGWCGL